MALDIFEQPFPKRELEFRLTREARKIKKHVSRRILAARVVNLEHPTESFERDIIGREEEVECLMQAVVLPLKYRHLFQNLN